MLLQEKNVDLRDKLELTITEGNNPYDFEAGELFSIACRNNPNRNFLLVSHLLGKHTPVLPTVPSLVGYLLASQLMEGATNNSLANQTALSLKMKHGDEQLRLHNKIQQNLHTLTEKTLFIGFAETATALGHAVFSSFEGDNITYLQTTRRKLDEEPSFTFEEEHSHATTHFCYADNKEFFHSFDHIVLVDDEISTGKTSLNLIRSLNQEFPSKRYSVLSILDLRNDTHLKECEGFTVEFGVNVEFRSIYSGAIHYSNKEVVFEESSESTSPSVETDLELIFTYPFSQSRFSGVRPLTQEGSKLLDMTAQDASEFLESYLSVHDERILVLGHSEFMYFPSKVAMLLQESGYDVDFYSTTRSPIYTSAELEYPVRSKIPFLGVHDIQYYLYNAHNNYDHVFLLSTENIPHESLNAITSQLQTKNLTVFFCKDY